MPVRILLASVVLLLSVAAPANAQMPADTVAAELPEVAVEAARGLETSASAPFAVSVVQRSDAALQMEAPVYVNDVVRDVPGVWMTDRGHFALGERLIIRGMGWRSPFGVRGVQVLLDGIPLTMPDGQAFLDIVDPLFLRSAEAIRGPSSLFWGNGSGGTLFLDSRPARDAPRAQVRIGGGGNGLQQLATEVVARTNERTVRLALSDLRRDGHRANGDGRFTRALLSAETPIRDRGRLRLMGAFVDQDARNPGSLTREQVEADRSQANGLFDAFDAGKQTAQGQLGANLVYAWDTVAAEGTVFGGFRDLRNPLPFAYIAFDRIYGGGRTALSGQAQGIAWHLGADVNVQQDDRINRATDIPNRAFLDTITLDQQETVWSTAAFGYARVPLTTRLTATLGARVDRVAFSLDDNLLAGGIDNSGRRTFSAVSPGAGLAFDTGPALLFANYNTAFETPTTTELVNRPGRPGGFNEGLGPQQTQGVEVGTRGAWAPANLTFDVALYYMHADDRLVQQEIPDSGGRVFFRNLGTNTHRGGELAVAWQPEPWLSLHAAYTANQVVFEDEALDGNRVPGLPDQRFLATARVDGSMAYLRLSWDAVSDYFADNANEVKADGYAVADVQVGLTNVEAGPLSLQPYAGVRNILDTDYIGSVAINARGNFFEPGAGRVLEAGVTVAL